MGKVSTKELQIAERARLHKGEALHSLHPVIDAEMLMECYQQQNKHSAPGIDGINWEDYGKTAQERIPELLRLFKTGVYKAPAIRRTYIPKTDGTKRPLGIPTIEDKVLQTGVRRVLEPVYEEDFKDFSFGFRPGRSAHQAIEYMFTQVSFGGMRYIIDADLKNYFGSISHGLMREFLARRVNDGVIRKMLDKWMRAGILEEGMISYPKEGTPQGGIISPLLGNIFLHYVLDEWFSEEIQPRLKGKSFIVRYADDFILGFENREDAERVMAVLPKRFGKYLLTLHVDKTKLIDLGTPWREGKRSFDFLGFTHYLGKSRKGKAILKRKTSSMKLTKAITQTEAWIKKNRHMKLYTLISELNEKLRGHYSYYGITFNSKGINTYYELIKRRLFKWLTRRGGKRKWNWTSYANLIIHWHPLLVPKIYHSFIS